MQRPFETISKAKSPSSRACTHLLVSWACIVWRTTSFSSTIFTNTFPPKRTETIWHDGSNTASHNNSWLRSVETCTRGWRLRRTVKTSPADPGFCRTAHRATAVFLAISFKTVTRSGTGAPPPTSSAYRIVRWEDSLRTILAISWSSRAVLNPAKKNDGVVIGGRRFRVVERSKKRPIKS